MNGWAKAILAKEIDEWFWSIHAPKIKKENRGNWWIQNYEFYRSIVIPEMRKRMDRIG